MTYADDTRTALAALPADPDAATYSKLVTDFARAVDDAHGPADPYRFGVVSCRICGEDHPAEFSYDDDPDGLIYRSVCPESDETEFYLIADVLLPGDPT